jgi:hypothetical protein
MNDETKHNQTIITGDIVASSIVCGNVVTARIINTDTNALRQWWHQILGHYGRYPSYAMFLALPADKEVIKYLKEFGKELHLITGKVCLVITLSDSEFMQYGSDFDDEIMPLAVQEHIAEGFCIQVAELFQMRYDEFPCLLLFRDIRKPEHIRISLKGLEAEEIAHEMRVLFSVLTEASKQGKDPLEAIEKHNKQQSLSKKRKAVWSSIQSFSGKTFEKTMEAFVEASIK